MSDLVVLIFYVVYFTIIFLMVLSEMFDGGREHEREKDLEDDRL